MEATNQGRKRVPPPSICCRTGECPRCIENERWDRVFREKFADPLYYDHKLRSASPIGDL
jgi:hypothetical protein